MRIMIKEEFSFAHLKDYLYDQIDLLVAGIPNAEERSHFFSDQWNNKSKDILFLNLEGDDTVSYKFVQNKSVKESNRIDLCVGLPKLMRKIGISDKKILLDMASLNNVLIMFLTKQFLIKTPPNTFFASYIRPNKYVSESGSIGYELCQQIGAVDAVPGFTKRETDNQTLCAFLGFEGVRLNGVLETVHSFEKLIPIVAFPCKVKVKNYLYINVILKAFLEQLVCLTMS